MGDIKTPMEEVPFTKFHWRLAVYSAGGPFCDGYILSIIALALVQMVPRLQMNSAEAGLIGSAALIGMFIGGLIFGYVTDKVGRQVMYIIDLAVFVIASLLQAFVTNITELIILRFILGVAIGADYPIATALLAEFAPRKHRASMLSAMGLVWFIGSSVAYLVGFFMLSAGPDAWRWMLASSAIPAVIVLMLRLGTPESPRWLLSKGREVEARAVVERVLGNSVSLEMLEEDFRPSSFGRLFESGYLKRTIFICIFWVVQVAPAFAILTFAPTILQAFHFDQGSLAYLGALLINIFFLIGLPIGWICVNVWGRRPLIIWSFFAMVVSLAVVGFSPKASTPVVIGSFALYAVFNGASSILDYIYPNELFPTEVRATAMGVGTAVSRIGAAGGTFLVPVALSGIGIGPSLLISAALTAIGLIACVAWAPETKGLPLIATSTVAKASGTGA